METIYLDHNATTPICPEAAEAMADCYAGGFANPASHHRTGQRAHKRLEDVRERIAELLGADLIGNRPDRLVFTASATEANNLALLGIPLAESEKPGSIVVSSMEHASVIGPAERLLEQGWRLDTLPAGAEGVVRLQLLDELLGEQTRLVSVQLGNHETGVIQPVEQIARLCDDAKVPMHTDAAQVVGKLPVDFRGLGVSAMSVAAHKFGGPLGIGALLLRHDVTIHPLMFGGHQQQGLRPGTESVALAVGMLAALETSRRDQEQNAQRIAALRDRFEAGLKAGFHELITNGYPADRLPNTSNLAFPGVDGQVLLMALDIAGVACSAGSACDSGSVELSPTLKAMGLRHEIVSSSIRFSLGATTAEAEVDEAVRRILHVCGELGGG
ncbi:MAG: cysteine desulfurase family protein [Thermoguttaceae bacterium]